MPGQVGTGLSTCLSRPSSDCRLHEHPLPDGGTRSHPQCGLRRSQSGCERQPGRHGPCPQGGPCPAGPVLRFARPLHLPPPAPSPLLGVEVGHQGSAARRGSSDEGRLTGAAAGPRVSQDRLGPCSASASLGVEQRHVVAGGEWTWSPGAAQGTLALQQPCTSFLSHEVVAPPSAPQCLLPSSLTAPGEPLHQTGSGPPGACRAVGLEAAQGSGCGPGGRGLPERTSGGTFGLAVAGICRGCGSGQVPAAAQLREDGGGWR